MRLALVDLAWLTAHLPAPLLRMGPAGLTWWQWIALVPLALIVWVLATGLAMLSVRIMKPLAAKTAATWDDELVPRTRGPLTLAWSVALGHLVPSLLDLPARTDRFVDGLLRALLVIALFWFLVRAVEIVAQAILRSPWSMHRPGSRSLIPLTARAGKVALVLMAGLSLLSAFGYPVATLVAGLGLGGLAFALAAQKTVENLFGSLSIGVDQPFRVGDTIKVEDVVGTVENIGLRSTQIRTAERTVVTIPNGKLADMRVESFTARDRIRLFSVLGLAYGTTAAQMREVSSGVEAALRDHPLLFPEGVSVRFRGLATSAMEVEVNAYFKTVDPTEFAGIRQELLLRFVEIVERAGATLAFPTQTVHLVTPEKEDRPKKRA